MFKRILILVTVLVLALTACAAAFAETMWIKTGNGKPANARSGPSKDTDLVGEFPYGSVVYTMGSAPVNGYTELSNGGGMWVLTKFLVSVPPAPYVPSPDSGKGSTPAQGTSDGLNTIYNEFKAAKWVTPYNVVTTHNRSSGVINMRYAPSKNAPLVDTYKPGETLIVICELKDWLEVQDPESGKTGFIRHDFLQR